VGQYFKDNKDWANNIDCFIDQNKERSSVKRIRRKEDDPTKKKTKQEIIEFHTKFKAWKEENGIPHDQKIFYVGDAYIFLKEEFLKMGYYFIDDPNTLYFDIKYTSKSVDVDYFSLVPGQIINHMIGSSAFTQKLGLTRYIRDSIWKCNLDCDEFYPRAYDLIQFNGLFNFIQDFYEGEVYRLLLKTAANEAFLEHQTVLAALLRIRTHSLVVNDYVIYNLLLGKFKSHSKW